ncbi:MAG: SDR family NAD(P)-dependent oxidoreductase [Paracoccaceae bacterium]
MLHVVSLDVCDGDSVDAAVQSVQATLGPVDTLVNAAGITAEQGVVGPSDALWQRILDTSLKDAFRLTRAVLQGMIQRKLGRIIQPGEVAALW